MAEDKNLNCRDCGNVFVFTAGEQTFFAEKGLSDPIRCPECRRLRKQQRAADSPMSDAAPRPMRTGGPDRGPSDRGPSDRGPSRSATMPPPSPGRLDGVDDEQRRVHRKPAKPANAKFTPPKRDLNAPVQKEKRPNNRRDEDKLLINWKEEVGLDEEADDDWLSYADEDEEEE